MAGLLIINADDFGVSAAVNAAVLAAMGKGPDHESTKERKRKNGSPEPAGLLTSASLMVTGEAAAEAVAIARDHPGLAVGLHIALTHAKPALTPYLIPLLADEGGRFLDHPVRVGVRLMRPAARRQIRAEVEAQFELFANLGLQLSHVDGHQHMHMHPAVLSEVIRLAEQYGAGGIRVPRESLRENLELDRSQIRYKTATALGHCLLRVLARRRLARTNLAMCDISVGSLMSGRMTPEYVRRILKSLQPHDVEVFFHPSTQAVSEPYGPNRGDLAALMDPELEAFVDAEGWRLATYADLARVREQAR